jgi:plastocyanin
LKTRFITLSLFLSAFVLTATTGCNATQKIAAVSPIDTLPSQTTVLSSITSTPGAPASSTPPIISSTPAAITETPGFTVPLDPAVYPPIVAGVVTVVIADGHFTPPIIQIPAGTTVEWQATDHLGDHAVYSSDGVLWGLVIAWIPLDKTFTTPGTYQYRDMSSMGGIGTVIVY